MRRERIAEKNYLRVMRALRYVGAPADPRHQRAGQRTSFAQIFDQCFVQTCVAEYAENAASREIFQDAMRCQ